MSFCKSAPTPHSHSPHVHAPHQHNPAPHSHHPSLPTFASAATLQADPWGAYYNAVNGELPTAYPVSVSSNWVLLDLAIIAAKVQNLPALKTCPDAALDRYTEHDAYQPPSISWIWHQYPYAALPASTRVEVFHEADPFGDEHFGMWLVYAPGSGIWFDLGRTIAFAEHADAYAHFGVPANVDQNEAMSKAAAAAGYNSVQFLAHVDHVNYPCDSKNTGKPGFSYMGGWR